MHLEIDKLLEVIFDYLKKPGGGGYEPFLFKIIEILKKKYFFFI